MRLGLCIILTILTYLLSVSALPLRKRACTQGRACWAKKLLGKDKYFTVTQHKGVGQAKLDLIAPSPGVIAHNRHAVSAQSDSIDNAETQKKRWHWWPKKHVKQDLTATPFYDSMPTPKGVIFPKHGVIEPNRHPEFFHHYNRRVRRPKS
ncbi:hypothetical protein AX15_004440 [Amanita polypyramis BW_CC]|nr:hypothetical protein AX15_004440 [Amanita polypyramis BW_CC]